MSELSEPNYSIQDELLTPKHSIPIHIHSLNISGSKGHFSSNLLPPALPKDKPQRPSLIPEIKHHKFQELYEDAAKRSAVKEKILTYSSLQKEKEADSFRSEKRLSRNASNELFDRLNKEAEVRNERYEFSKKMQDEAELKVLKNPKINKSSVSLSQDVVTRLLQYGEETKRKNEERIRKKKEKEEEEIKKITSWHRRGNSENNSFSSFSTPGKPLTDRYSPQKHQISNNKASFSAVEQRNQSEFKSLHTPDKVIQKIRSAIGRVSPFNGKFQQNKAIKITK